MPTFARQKNKIFTFLQCHVIKFYDNTHTAMDINYTLRRIEESDIPFLYELFYDSEVTKLMNHSFQTENEAREYFVFISGVNEEGSEPGKVYLILDGQSAPMGIVGFDYILGPTAYLVMHSCQNIGDVESCIEQGVPAETWQTLQKHHCKSKRLQRTCTKSDSEIAF